MIEDYPPIAKDVLLVDFDGTIKPWANKEGRSELFHDPADLPPIAGSIAFMQIMADKGYKVGIFTSRLSETWLQAEGYTPLQQRKYIKQYCDYWEIPFSFMTSEKVPAMQYFDDKATTVKDNWADIIEVWR